MLVGQHGDGGGTFWGIYDDPPHNISIYMGVHFKNAISFWSKLEIVLHFLMIEVLTGWTGIYIYTILIET